MNTENNPDYDKLLHSLHRKQRNSGILYALVPLGIIIIVLLFFGNNLNNARIELRVKNDSLRFIKNTLASKYDSLRIVDSSLNAAQERYNNIITGLKSLDPNIQKIITQRNTKDSGNEIRQLLIADDKVRNYIQNKRSDVKHFDLFYYERSADNGLVKKALSGSGLGFTPKQTKQSLNGLPSNYIAYGRKVDLEYVKIIAYALIKEGIGIKKIIQIQQGKETRVEIACKASLQKEPNLTIEEIEKLN